MKSSLIPKLLLPSNCLGFWEHGKEKKWYNTIQEHKFYVSFNVRIF